MAPPSTPSSGEAGGPGGFPLNPVPEPGHPSLNTAIQGIWVAAYGPLIFSSSVAAPLELGADYAPVAAIVTLVFANDGRHMGEVHLNVAGVQVLHRLFDGNYHIRPNPRTGTVEGNIHLRFADSDPVAPGQQVHLYFIMRSRDEIVFMVESGTSPEGVATPANTVVQGTLGRVKPVLT